MTVTLRLSEANRDLEIINGTFRLVSGADEVAQRVELRLLHFLGEYFLDTAAGVPWYEQILGQNTNAGDITLIFRNQIAGTPGVDRVGPLIVNFDTQSREFSISGEAFAESGESIPININQG